jgi:hypothetical protein
MMNEVWFDEVLCPNRLEMLVRGKPSISLMLGRKKKSRSKNNSIVAVDFLIGRDMACNDDF